MFVYVMWYRYIGQYEYMIYRMGLQEYVRKKYLMFREILVGVIGVNVVTL